MWLRYKHKFASGEGIDDWEYFDLGDGKYNEESLKDMLNEIQNEYNWSEHYRGVDSEIVKSPPKEVLQLKLNEARGRVASYIDLVAYLERQIKELE
jgi:hypothetical protein